MVAISRGGIGGPYRRGDIELAPPYIDIRPNWADRGVECADTASNRGALLHVVFSAIS